MIYYATAQAVTDDPDDYVTFDWPGDGGTSHTVTWPRWRYERYKSHGWYPVRLVYHEPSPVNRGTLRKIPSVTYHFPARPVGRDTAYHLRFKRMI